MTRKYLPIMMLLILAGILVWAGGKLLPAAAQSSTPDDPTVIQLAPHASQRPSLAAPLTIPNAPGLNYNSFTGPDFRSIDPYNVQTTYASGSSGGIYVRNIKDTNFDIFLEADAGLPRGAIVTDVTFYYRDCYLPAPLQFYFGAYPPDGSGFVSYGKASSKFTTSNCKNTDSLTIPINPAISIDLSQARYVLGVQSFVVFAKDVPTTPIQIIYGARIGYKNPSSLLPLVAR
jgi:hypothetical protein